MQISNGFITAVASLVGSSIFQFVKKKTGWGGDKAYWLAFSLSVLISAGGLAAFGELDLSPVDAFVTLAAILGQTQVAFKIIVQPVDQRFF